MADDMTAFFPADTWRVVRQRTGWALYLLACPHRPGDPACACSPKQIAKAQPKQHQPGCRAEDGFPCHCTRATK